MQWSPLASLITSPPLHSAGLSWTLAVRAELRGEPVDTFFVTGKAIENRESFTCGPESTPRLIAAILLSDGRIRLEAQVLDIVQEVRAEIEAAGEAFIATALGNGDIAEGEAKRYTRRFAEKLEQLLPAKGKEKEERVWVPGSAAYADVQRAIALNTFGDQEGQWPRARLERANGFAELRPIPPSEEMFVSVDELEAMKERMWRNREELTDADVDVMDALSAHWIRHARATSDKVPVILDDLLKLRGLKSKKGGERRGGFEPEQRRQLWWSLLKLQDLWLDIAERPGSYGRKRVLQSRALVLTDRLGQQRLDGKMDVSAILIMPGEAFARFLLGPGRQVALMSSKALHYDPYRQQPEKRLARYFAWQWRVNAGGGVPTLRRKVDTLLQEIGLPLEGSSPSRIRDRLEKALERLLSDSVVARWRYSDDFSEENLPRQGWLPLWREAVIRLEAPEGVKDAYRSLARAKKILPPRPPSLGQQLKEQRTGLKISQESAAKEIGITQGYLSAIEAGRKPGAKVLEKIRSWLERKGLGALDSP